MARGRRRRRDAPQCAAVLVGGAAVQRCGGGAVQRCGAPSALTSRLPMCGSAWKNPFCSICRSVHCTRVSMMYEALSMSHA